MGKYHLLIRISPNSDMDGSSLERDKNKLAVNGYSKKD